MKLNTICVRICYIMILTYLIMMILKHLDIVKEQFHMLYETFYDDTNTGVSLSNLLKDTRIRAGSLAYNPIITNDDDTNVDDTNIDDSNTNKNPLTLHVKKVPRPGDDVYTDDDKITAMNSIYLDKYVKPIQNIGCKITPWGKEICYDEVVQVSLGDIDNRIQHYINLIKNDSGSKDNVGVSSVATGGVDLAASDGVVSAINVGVDPVATGSVDTAADGNRENNNIGTIIGFTDNTLMAPVA